MRNDGHCEACSPDGGPVDPGSLRFDSQIVDQESCLEVVGTIQQQVRPFAELFDIRRIDIDNNGFDRSTSVYAPEFLGGGGGLGQVLGDIVLVEEGLAMQITQLDVVSITDAQMAYAGAHEHIRHCGSKSPAPYQDRAGPGKAPLTIRADLSEQHLRQIAGQPGLRWLRIKRCV